MSTVRPDTVLATTPPRTREWISPNAWIIGPRSDLLLFLGTPLLLLAVFGLAERLWNVAALSVFATVLAMGHYLPGFVRAYGDRALFQRFRWRFLLAPVFFITTAVVMTHRGSHVFLMVVVIWGAWHWLMQTYGLVRIYDAKAKNFDSATARLDYALCLAWFGVLYWQTDGASGVLMHYYRAGGRLPPEWIPHLVRLWWVVTLAITAVYVLHTIRRARAGQPPSLLKLALLGVSFFFYLYAFGYSSSKLVAFGLFEGYHDIQYLAIVWIFNRNRARDPQAGSFTRFLFQQRMPLILLYIGLCLAFGSYDFVARSLNEGALATTAISIITGLALLHFYFDGFIWRIREPETRSTLGVDGTQPALSRFRLSPAMRHGLLWGILLAPLTALAIWEESGAAMGDVEACRAVIRARPDSHKTHYLLSSELTRENRLDEARVHIERARQLRPGYDLYEMQYADLMLGRSDLSTEQLDEIIACYNRTSRIRPELANLHRNWAKALCLKGDLDQAVKRYEASLSLDAASAITHYDYAIAQAKRQEFAIAERACAAALKLEPQYVDALALRATLLMQLNRPGPAVQHYRQVLQLDPMNQRAKTQLALALASTQDARVRDPGEAVELANQVRQAAEDSEPSLLRDLSSVYFAAGDRPAAIGVLQRAAELYLKQGNAAAAEQIGAMVSQLKATSAVDSGE